MTPPLPYRQVHLDFHTSPYISDLLSEFDAAAFAKTMSEAHVNSVTVFAKCHHGMSYYPRRSASLTRTWEVATF
jgi:proteasome lid subunit RPN8/RPN11